MEAYIKTERETLIFIIMNPNSTPEPLPYGNIISNNSQDEVLIGTSNVTIAFQAGLYGLLIVFGICLNTCVLWLVYTKRSLRTVTNMWVVSLCASQLSLCVLSIPFATIATLADDWLMGEVFCKINGFYTTSIRTVSIISVAGIALDRYHVISRPFGARIRKSSARRFIGLTWWCAIVACLPPLVGIGSYRYSPLNHMCGISWSLGGSALVYTVFYVLSTFTLSFVLSCFAYQLIYKVTKKQVRKRRRPSVAGGLATVITNVNNISRNNNNNNNNSSTSNSSNSGVEENQSEAFEISQDNETNTQENTNHVPISPARRRLTSIFAHRSLSMTYSGLHRLSGLLAPSSFLHGSIDSRAAQTIILVLTVYIITWLPYFILSLYSAATGGILKNRYFSSPPTSLTSSQWLEFSVTWLSFSNVVWDPLLYGFFNHNFRNHLKDMRWYRRIQQRNYNKKRERRYSLNEDDDVIVPTQKTDNNRTGLNNWQTGTTIESQGLNGVVNEASTVDLIKVKTPRTSRHRHRSPPNLLHSTSVDMDIMTASSIENTRYFLPQVVILPTSEYESLPRIRPRVPSDNSAVSHESYSSSHRKRSIEELRGSTSSKQYAHVNGSPLRYLEVPMDSPKSKGSVTPRSSRTRKTHHHHRTASSVMVPSSKYRTSPLHGYYNDRSTELPFHNPMLSSRGHKRQHSYTPTVLSPLASNVERTRRKRISSNESSLKPDEMINFV